MKLRTPRLRMFAGPNGSGKSTIKGVVSKYLLGVYINPDEIEEEIKKFDFLNFDLYEIETNESEVLTFFSESTLLKKIGLQEEAKMLRFNKNKLIFFDVSVNAYFASVCADFMRRKLLEARKSFTFETVMSSIDKVELLKIAKKSGYRTYLYYIAINDPIINISRVKQRVKSGGHDVPEDKIISRYTRSLENLHKAIKQSNRAYIFDNSSHSHTWICEITDGKSIKYKQDKVPQWFYKHVIKKLEYE
jgi:predicted ABC-type ATPase